ncbi:MAG: peptidylprolyl isomerase [Gammaproteobacteria bacterium]|nr:peptidylprolyl isomerase [Gammaproteobacteria bacterium]
MLTIDWLLCAALAVAVGAWWMTGLEARRRIVALASLVALVTGVVAVLDHRWQAAGGVAVAVLLLVSALAGKLREDRKPLRVPYVSGALFALLGVVAFGLLYVFVITGLPAPSGEHPVGVRDFELSDESRKGVLAAGDDEPRRLLVRVWYPAGDVAGLSPRPYFNEIEAETTASGLGSVMGMPFFFQYLKHSATNSYENAPLLDGAASQPVVIYSHGYTSFPGQNTALLEELASHGYIVFSVQHTYDSSPVVFPNGDVAGLDPALFAEMEKLATEMSEDQRLSFVGATFDERRRGTRASYERSMRDGQRIPSVSAAVWRADRIFVHDRLEAGEVPGEVVDIVAAGDLGSVGEIGMSFGGSTTGGVCMVDPRCAAGVNLDGGDYDFQPFNRNVPAPFLMVYSDLDELAAVVSGDPDATGHGFNDFSYERHETAGLRSDVHRLMVDGVTHLGVSDFSLFMRMPWRRPLFGSIDAGAIIGIQNDFVRGFFDRHLRGIDNGFPAGEYARYSGDVRPYRNDGLREWWLAANPVDRTVQVVLETSLGELEVALYPERAPLSTAQFLAHVDAGHYDGASFYRATRRSRGSSIEVVQGGLLAHVMGADSEGLEAYSEAESAFPPVAHETTDRTGIPNERGSIAFARLDPGTANSEFFFNVQDNPVLDTGYTAEGRDGHGYATFGRVLRGMRVLERIQRLPSDAPTAMEMLQGQILEEPVVIRRAYRVAAAEG